MTPGAGSRKISSTMTQANHLSWVQRVVLFILAKLIRLWCSTLRVKVEAPKPNAFYQNIPKPMIVLFWHNRLFLSLKFHFTYWSHRNAFGLTSASKDGAWVAGLLGYMGLGAIRGSSSRRGAQALREMLDVLEKQKADIVVTPDGPRGPKYSIKEGLISFAQKASNPMMLVSADYKSAWRLKGWDGFYIPKPFSTIVIRPSYFASFADLETQAKEQDVTIEDYMRNTLLKGCPKD
jgi:lysophospholipid acyltransferase (LPLAT)-like uncharacterized protein